jgi:hypothetical protein
MCGNQRRVPDRLVRLGQIKRDQPVPCGVYGTRRHDPATGQESQRMGIRHLGIPDHVGGGPLHHGTAVSHNRPHQSIPIINTVYSIPTGSGKTLILPLVVGSKTA